MQSNEITLTMFAAHPAMSSEAGIGWLFLKHFATIADAEGFHITAYMNGRSAAGCAEQLSSIPGGDRVRLVAVDAPQMFAFLRDPRFTRLEYLFWNWNVRRRLKTQDHEARRARLAMHVTFASEMLPTPIGATSAQTLKVWGPVGSSGSWRAFTLKPREPQWFRDALAQAARNVSAALISRANRRGIDIILAQTADVAKYLKSERNEVRIFPNLVLKDSLLPTESTANKPRSVECNNPQLRIFAAGHLIPRKRFSLAMSALTQPGLERASLFIAGAPLPGVRNYLPAIAARLGVTERVHFLGKIEREEVLSELERADVFIHLAAREGAPGIVGEATTVGVPVICFEGTGAAGVVRMVPGPHVVLPDNQSSVDSLGKHVLRAAAMTRKPYSGWTESRVGDLLRLLLSEAVDPGRAP